VAGWLGLPVQDETHCLFGYCFNRSAELSDRGGLGVDRTVAMRRPSAFRPTILTGRPKEKNFSLAAAEWERSLLIESPTPPFGRKPV
jgi:hypothetical protein